MAIRIVRLGTPRLTGEGLRIGSVRRPPRGVKKERFSADDWFDVWYPNLSPSPETMTLGREATSDRDWKRFVDAFRREMATPENARTIELLAALSRDADFSLGCYCEVESRCHRSVLRDLLVQAGADVR